MKRLVDNMDNSDLLLVGFDNSDKDIAVLVVSRKDDKNNIRMINAIQGTDAVRVYEKLIGASLAANVERGGNHIRSKD